MSDCSSPAAARGEEQPTNPTNAQTLELHEGRTTILSSSSHCEIVAAATPHEQSWSGRACVECGGDLQPEHKDLQSGVQVSIRLVCEDPTSNSGSGREC